MSQKNIDLVTRAARAATARPTPDYDTVNALYHPDHVLVPILSELEGREYRGARGFQAFLVEQEGIISWEMDLAGAVDVGHDKVLAVFDARWRGSGSGAQVEQRIWVVATLADGLVARTEVFATPADAIEALGRTE
jgi:ketosteroid isomerase-like protein